MGFMVVRFCVFDDRYQAGGAVMCPTQNLLELPVHGARSTFRHDEVPQSPL
jgi:hypothetical protein